MVDPSVSKEERDGSDDSAVSRVKQINGTRLMDGDLRLFRRPPSFWEAVERGNADAVRWYLEKEFDANFTNQDGMTAVLVAARNGHAKVVRCLLEHGATTEAKTKYGETAFLIAARHGHAAVVRCLLEYGANTEAEDKAGWTALIIAANNRHLATVRCLLESGANTEATNQYGETALLIAARHGHADIVRCLLEHGASTEIQDKYGRTPLLIAAVEGHANVVCCLLEPGASVEASDEVWRSALVDAILQPDVPHQFRPRGTKRYDVVKVLCKYAARSDPTHVTEWDNQDHSLVSGDERKLRIGLFACAEYWIKQRSRNSSTDLADVPEEVYQGGKESVEMYLRSIATTSVKQIVRRRKICVVGPSRSGKTSLIKSLSEQQTVLVDDDDRTIGIDLFGLDFTTSDDTKYEASVWDFAGQDVYQVVHSLYFSKRMLYLVFVDTAAYADQLDAMAEDGSRAAQLNHRRWVQDRVWRWIRLVLARQPDAEMVIVCSKSDQVSGEASRAVINDLQAELTSYINDLMRSKEDGPAKDAVKKSLDECQQRKRLNVSVKSEDTLQKAWRDIQRVVAEQHARAFPMPRRYTQVLEAIKKMRANAQRLATDAERVTALLVPVATLIDRLVDQIDGLNERDGRQILITLHYLGDILWYEQEYRMVKAGVDVVILDPRLMLDIVREVVNHELAEGVDEECDALYNGGKLQHALLETFPLWGPLCDQNPELVLFFKRLLQQSNLAYPLGNKPLEWDSDVMVPAYWKVNKTREAADEDAWLQSIEAEGCDHTLQWQYTLPAEVSETLFDQFVVQSYTVDQEREASASILYIRKAGEYQARILHVNGEREHRENVVVIDAAAVSNDVLWAQLKSLVSAIEEVVSGYPGLGIVQRHVVKMDIKGKPRKFDLRRILKTCGSDCINDRVLDAIQARVHGNSRPSSPVASIA